MTEYIVPKSTMEVVTATAANSERDVVEDIVVGGRDVAAGGVRVVRDTYTSFSSTSRPWRLSAAYIGCTSPRIENPDTSTTQLVYPSEARAGTILSLLIH